MKLSFSTIVLPVTLLAYTATAFLEQCDCRPTFELDFWKADIDAFINRYKAVGPTELPISPYSSQNIYYNDLPVIIRLKSKGPAVTLTKQAAVDLFWELKAKRSSLGCDNGGRGIQCARASRGTPEFEIRMENKTPPATLGARSPAATSE